MAWTTAKQTSSASDSRGLRPGWPARGSEPSSSSTMTYSAMRPRPNCQHSPPTLPFGINRLVLADVSLLP
jgi:hypothetical protein